jgi:hypothetical protein
MSEEMFSDPAINWAELSPADMIMIRAAAPADVFTLTAREAYIEQTSDQPGLSVLCDVLWLDDYELVRHLPPIHKGLKGPLIKLIRLAYERGIRPTDDTI